MFFCFFISSLILLFLLFLCCFLSSLLAVALLFLATTYKRIPFSFFIAAFTTRAPYSAYLRACPCTHATDPVQYNISESIWNEAYSLARLVSRVVLEQSGFCFITNAETHPRFRVICKLVRKTTLGSRHVVSRGVGCTYRGVFTSKYVQD